MKRNEQQTTNNQKNTRLKRINTEKEVAQCVPLSHDQGELCFPIGGNQVTWRTAQ